MGWMLVALATLFLQAPGWGQTPPAPPPATTTPTATSLVTPPLPAGTTPLVAADHPLSLHEALALALREQPSVTIANANAQAAAAQTRQTAAGAKPSVSLSSSFSHYRPSSGDANSYSTTVSGSQLVYDFGRTATQIRRAKDRQQASEAAYAQARQDVVDSVKSAYYVLLEDQRLVEVQQRSVTDQQAHLGLAQARFDAGVAPRADVLTAQSQVSQAQYSLMQALNTAAQARVSLNLAMGIDVRTPTQVEETEEQLPTPTPEALVQEALDNRPEVRQLRASLLAAEASVKIARANQLPSLTAGTSVGVDGTEFPGDSHSWSYGLSLSWDLYDSGLTKGLIAEAEANLVVAQANLKQTELSIGSAVVKAYLDVQSAGQQVVTAEAGVVSADEALRVATGRYEAGVAPYLDVTDAETTLITAQTNQVNAKYGLSLARAALLYALGREDQ